MLFKIVLAPEQNLVLHILEYHQKNKEYSTNWRNQIIAIITRDRIVDASLKKQIEKRTLDVCELHYPEEKIRRRE